MRFVKYLPRTCPGVRFDATCTYTVSDIPDEEKENDRPDDVRYGLEDLEWFSDDSEDGPASKFRQIAKESEEKS